jgi:hypothetical protein
MSGNPFAEKDNSNGEYRLNPNTVRAGLVAATIGLLSFGSLGIWAGVQEGFTSKGPIMSLPQGTSTYRTTFWAEPSDQ